MDYSQYPPELQEHLRAQDAKIAKLQANQKPAVSELKKSTARDNGAKSKGRPPYIEEYGMCDDCKRGFTKNQWLMRRQQDGVIFNLHHHCLRQEERAAERGE